MVDRPCCDEYDDDEEIAHGERYGVRFPTATSVRVHVGQKAARPNKKSGSSETTRHDHSR